MIKRAVVVSKKTDNIRFLEDVNANQGQQIKIFFNFEEAREWLK